MRNIILRVLIPGAITLMGIVIIVAFFLLRGRAERKPPQPRVAVVEIQQVELDTQPVELVASGVVTPSREVTVIPEVSGRIVSQSPSLIPGGRFEQGDVLARIDARDYTLAVRQEESRVKQAELDLELELGRQGIAEREWELLGDGRAAEDVPLALRKPHLLSAEHNLESARGGLGRAQLGLERTVLRAPFNALVLTESVDVGQVVGPTTAAVSLVGTDRFWVKVSVPVERLGAVNIPGVNAEEGSPAQVVHKLGGGDTVLPGHVLRLLGELDGATRTAQLLVAVDQPLDGEMPLLPGSFVEVRVQGRGIEGAVSIPRAALVEDERVWVIAEDETLARREVTIGWRAPTQVIVTEGLETGDRLVVSPLSRPVVGTPVKLLGTDSQADDGAAGASAGGQP